MGGDGRKRTLRGYSPFHAKRMGVRGNPLDPQGGKPTARSEKGSSDTERFPNNADEGISVSAKKSK